MKNNFAVQKGLIRRVKSAVAILGVLVSAQFAAQCQPAPASPVGTWDISFTGGGREGLANITFFDDFTFDGFEIIAPGAKSGSSGNGRDGSGGNRVPSPNNPSIGTNIFGLENINGPWGFDSQGHVIGFWIELADATVCTTNVTVTSVTTTNGGTTTTSYFTNETVNCNALTNQVSFVGKASPGQRLTMVGSTSTGKVTYKGVPFVPLPDISGSWYGFKKEQQQSFLEFFTLSPFDVNSYQSSGSGPGYTYDGFVMLSAQKKIAFVSTVSYPTVVTNMLSAVGSFNSKKFNAQTKGVEITGPRDKTFPLTFNGTKFGP